MVDKTQSNIQRISRVLKGFDGHNTPRSTHTIILDVGMSRSTGFALLHALTVRGWLERTGHGFLCLGPKAFGLAFGSLDLPQGLGQSSRLVATARTDRYLENLVNKFETFACFFDFL